MYQIDNDTAATSLPASTSAGTAGYFTDGNAATGVAATVLPAEFMNMVMMELANLCTSAGLTLDKADYTQVTQAVKSLIASLSTVSWDNVTDKPTTLDISGASTLGSTLSVAGAVTLAKTLAVSGAATFNSSVALSGNLDVGLAATIGNSIELGAQSGVASTPFIDFHSGATDVDYDVRVIATGGTGTAGGGDLTINAALTNVNGFLSVVTSETAYGLSVTNTGGNGAGILLQGNGTTTPNKYVRAQGGQLEVVNSAFSSVVFSISDAGAVVTYGALTSKGNITSNGLVYAGGGTAYLAANGDVYGTTWSGLLSTYLANSYLPNIAFGAIGSYGLFVVNTGTGTGSNPIQPGTSIAGANLVPADAAASVASSTTTVSGTWRLMGFLYNADASAASDSVSLLQRIA